MSETPVDDELLHSHLEAAVARSQASLQQARCLLASGFPSAALVWAVRSAEGFMRYFVLAPHFMEAGHSWEESMELGRRKLGSNSWAKAFRAAEEWYGPFDAALTENGDDAWTVWKDDIVARRHELVHGVAVQEATSEEAGAVIRFAERLMTWYPQRFLVSTRHPINQRLRQILSKPPRANDERTNEMLEEIHMRTLPTEGE